METKPLKEYFLNHSKMLYDWWPQARLLNLLGLWPVDQANRVALTVYSYILLGLIMTAKILHIVEAFYALQKGDFKVLVVAALVISLDMWSVIRWYCLATNSPAFSKIINDIHRLTQFTSQLVPEVVDKELKSRVKRCKIIFFFFTIQPMGFTLHWVAWPLVDRMLYQEREFINLVVSLACVTVFESFFFSALEMLTGHYMILSKELEVVTGNRHVVSRMTHKVTIKDCITHHQQLIKICLELKEATASILLWHSSATVGIICIGVFALTEMISEMNSNKITNFVELVSGATFHLFVSSLLCQELTDQSEKIPLEAYMTEWYMDDFTISDRKSLGIMMTMSRHPIVFGGFISVGIANFIGIMKAAFSYYNFLITVK